jgi:hypothetical protein
VLAATVCREMLTREAPHASIDGRRDSNACKSRLHAGHHEPVQKVRSSGRCLSSVSDATATPRWSHNRKVGAQLPALSERSACRVAIKYSVALRVASAASRLLGFVAGREAAAGVFSLFVMSGLPCARGGQ